MTDSIRTVTPAGEPIVILAADVYDRLVTAAEDARDAAIADAALRDYWAGMSTALDADDMTALLDAPTPIAFWREKRGLTLETLADQLAVNADELARIETGECEGLVGLYARLAEIFGLKVDDLLP